MKHESAVSELVGALILVALVLTGMGVIGVSLLSQPPPDTRPMVSLAMSCAYCDETEDEDGRYVTLLYHDGGDPVIGSDLEIMAQMNSSGEQNLIPVEPTGVASRSIDWCSGEWTNWTTSSRMSIGDTLKVDMDERPYKIIVTVKKENRRIIVMDSDVKHINNEISDSGSGSGSSSGGSSGGGDFDGDGDPDVSDPDDDNDGIPDVSDPDPYNPSIPGDESTTPTDYSGLIPVYVEGSLIYGIDEHDCENYCDGDQQCLDGCNDLWEECLEYDKCNGWGCGACLAQFYYVNKVGQSEENPDGVTITIPIHQGGDHLWNEYTGAGYVGGEHNQPTIFYPTDSNGIRLDTGESTKFWSKCFHNNIKWKLADSQSEKADCKAKNEKFT
ncbi:MAG: type IV pilin N-terminal domain-containing protein [Methanospirillaceae archaeon]|nr:type IV pilin N-terminal domain-containing protein [Methanospirillaceae archaeon]